jgi:hypothetical protein
MKNKPKFLPNPKLKLMDQAHDVLRYHHYAYRTEQTYCQWIRRFIYFFGGKRVRAWVSGLHISHISTPM